MHRTIHDSGSKSNRSVISRFDEKIFPHSLHENKYVQWAQLRRKYLFLSIINWIMITGLLYEDSLALSRITNQYIVIVLHPKWICCGLFVLGSWYEFHGPNTSSSMVREKRRLLKKSAKNPPAECNSKRIFWQAIVPG